MLRWAASSVGRCTSRAIAYNPVQHRSAIRAKLRSPVLPIIVHPPATVQARQFHSRTGRLLHGEYEWQDPKSEDEVVNIKVINREGEEIPLRGKVGDNLLYLCHRYAVEMEGACEASLACSTCHCYVDHDYLDKLPEPKEEEEDMLDLAVFVKENSRLGCQIMLSKDLEGMTVALPKATRNFYVDGHVPKPH